MQIVCAWCEKAGLPALMRVMGPLDDGAESHGICGAHAETLLAEVARRRSDRMTAHPPAARYAALEVHDTRGLSQLRHGTARLKSLVDFDFTRDTMLRAHSTRFFTEVTSTPTPAA